MKNINTRSFQQLYFFFCLLTILIFCGYSSAIAKTVTKAPPRSDLNNINSILALDPTWQSEKTSPFIKKQDGYKLATNIGSAKSIHFPQILNSHKPIIIKTLHGEVKQYLLSSNSYKAEVAGRYLVYKGDKDSILYRYDSDKRQLREFVYIAEASAMPKNGEVIKWRFEGAGSKPQKNGSVTLNKTVDVKNEVSQVSDKTMAERIDRFMKNRFGKKSPEILLERPLFLIPAPEYVTQSGETRKQGIHYRLDKATLTVAMTNLAPLIYPLWVDPSFMENTFSDLILNGQEANDQFGYSVASAGDFNNDGLDDVIIGAPLDNNNSGSAFIFFGSQTGTINNPDTNADVVLNGQASGDFFGGIVSSAGDFNGDGIDDVIVSAYLDDNNGQLDSGSAFVFFGGQTGTINNPDTNANVVLNGQGANDQFGISVASAGDFNGDGLGDVIVGAYLDDNNGQTDSGSAFIFFGGQTGTISNPDTNANVVLNGQGAGDFFGGVISSAGDFNGDNLSDVIVGSPLDDNNGLTNSGSAFIFFGGQIGTINNPDSNANVVINGQEINSALGTAVSSAGDFNGDGLSDVIVGAPFDDTVSGGQDSGSVYIFFGGQTGTISNPDTNADVVLTGQEANALFGASVAHGGDINNDGLGDVIIGVPFDNHGNPDVGGAYVYYGGVTGTINLPSDNADIYLVGISANSGFGGTVASAGDFNGDGFDDFIIGAPFEDNNGLADSGSAFLNFGWAILDGDDDADVLLTGLNGSSVASAGDFNGDGLDDVIVGDIHHDHNGLGASGSAFIFFGGKNGTIDNPETNADVVLNGQDRNDQFGFSVASAGDFNGDGLDDVIVGSRLDDNNNLTDSGSAYIYFGGRTGTINNPDTNADVVLNGQVEFDKFGGTVASAGDFNGDGLSDVIVGAPAPDNAILFTHGKAYIFFGGRTGTINNPDTNADVVLISQADTEGIGGSVASAGDFNGDGLDDVILGAAGSDNNGLEDSGSALIFFGGQTGTIPDAELNADVILNGQNADDLFGFSVASAGDFNGDGLDDVIVGTPFVINISQPAGRAYVISGGKTGIVNNPDTNADVTIISRSATSNFAGSVASTGDFNGDGLDDVIVGASRDGHFTPGSAFIFFGGQTGTFDWPQFNSNLVIQGRKNQTLGKSVASAGDFNGDGRDDIIVSSAGARIFFSPFTGSPKSNDVVLNLPSGVTVQLNDNASSNVLHPDTATAVATADVDNNGQDDVIVSFPAGTGPDANGGTYISRNQGALVSLDSKTAEHIAVGDVDGNGQQDLLLGFGTDGFWLAVNDAPPFLFIDLPVSAVASGDVDNNGQDDIVLSITGVATVALKNLATADVLDGSAADTLATADVDNNGEDDVIASFPAGTGPSGTGGTYVAKNQGALTLLDSKTAEHIAVGDVDGNGQEDLLFGFGADGLWLGVNDTPPFLFIDLPLSALAAGDIDANGQDDAVLSITGVATVAVKNLATVDVLGPGDALGLATGQIDGN